MQAKIMEQCPRCFGRGYCLRYGVKMTSTYNCPRCNGSGEIIERPSTRKEREAFEANHPWAGGPHTANDYQVRNGIAVIGVYDCPADADDCAEAAREDDPNRVVWVKTAENFPKTP